GRTCQLQLQIQASQLTRIGYGTARSQACTGHIKLALDRKWLLAITQPHDLAKLPLAADLSTPVSAFKRPVRAVTLLIGCTRTAYLCRCIQLPRDVLVTYGSVIQQQGIDFDLPAGGLSSRV